MTRALLGLPVQELRRPWTRSLVQTGCRDCGAPITRTYAAIYAAQRQGRGCVCQTCLPLIRNYAKPLDAHREGLITRHAKTEAQTTALRALLRCASDAEPLRISSLAFWARLRDLVPGVSRATQQAYYYHAKGALGL